MDDVRKISKKYYLREIMACFLVSCLFFNAPVALAEVVLTANPVGTILVDPVVPAVGDYDFTQAMSASDGSIGEFSNFDIASDLWVTCTQPTTTSNALFKVDSPDGTQILGRFDATGNVYLRDGGGFFIGVDGIVNANKFVASTLVIDNVEWQAFVGDPISNKLKFGPGGADPGAVTENTGTITAPDGVYLVGPQVLNSGTINSDLVVMAAGDKVYLKHDVGSKVYIEMPSDLLTSDPTFNKVDNSGTINTAGQVLLAAGDIFSTALNAGSLAATANRDITLTGTVQTTGDIELAAARDVQIKDDVTTGGNLSIEATSGAIDAKGATIYMDDDKTLTITQNASIAMETGFTVSNSENTDLVATSTGGLFTSAAAPDWKSITASANGDVTLNDMLSGGTITAGALTSTVGNIDVRSDHGQVLATDTITAGGNVSLTGRDGIELGADVTSGGFQNYNSDVELKADVTAASTGAGNITFASKVDGGQSLTVNTAGVTKFQGEVGGTIPLSLLQTDAPGSTQINGGLVTTAGEPGDQRYYDPVTLGRNTTLNGHNVQFYSTLDSGCIIPRSLLVNADAITGFWGEVGGIAPLASLETDSPGSTWLFNADVTTTGAQTYGDPVKVGRPGGIITTRSTEGGNITFAQTVDNHHKASPPTGLNVETAGVTKFQGVVGGTEPLASLTTDAPGRTEISTGTINLNGSSATFGDPVLLMANLTINEAGTGNIEFASTVDSEEGSNHTLTVNSGAGATIFGDAVGSDALDGLSDDEGLGAVTTNAAGTTQINGGSVTTTGDQTYNDPVTLGDNTTLNGTNVTFAQTLDSDSGNYRGLYVWAGGVTKFNGAVGATDPLYWLSTDFYGSTQINGGSVTTSWLQQYVDPVTLGADTTLNSQDVQFLNTLNSDSTSTPRTLLVNSYMETLFGSTVGGIAALASLTTDAPGSTQINGGLVTTTGDQTYNDPVTLGAATTLNGTNVTFANTLNSDSVAARSLLVNASGVTKFQGQVGGIDALASLTTDAPGSTQINGGLVTTTGEQAYGDPVTLGADTILTGGSGSHIGFASTVDSQSGSNYNLTVYTPGVTMFLGEVGGIDALASLTTDAPGSTQINGGLVTTTGDQTYNDPVTLGAATTLNGTNVTFAQTLDSDDVVTARSLVVNASGVTQFQGEVGGIAALASLTTDAPGSTELSTNVTTTGAQTYNDDVDLMGDVIAESTGDDDITFAKTVDGGHNLTVNTSGNTRFGGNVGSETTLVTLTTDAGGRTFVGGDVTTTSGITFGDNVFADGTGSPLDQQLKVENGPLTAEGFVWKVTPGDLYLYGNTEPGTDAISLNNNRDSGCPLLACLPAASTCLGNLELFAPSGDIQISGDLTTFGMCCYGGEPGPALMQNGGDDGYCDGWYDRPTGGVSVIAQDGKIYTAADSPDPEAGDYMLNIGIVGNSDDVSHRVRVNGNGENHAEGLGVDLPWLDEGEEGKAAIVVLSREDLVFGPDTQLIAKGKYDASFVDDRPGVDFLATPDTSIGGVVRDEGDAMDVAIYTGSMGTEEGQGNVHLDGRAIDVEAGGTMVVDAYDTVTFGDFDTFDLSTFEGCADMACVLIKLALRFHGDIEGIDREALCSAFHDYADGYDGENLLEDFLNDYFDEGAFFNIDRMEVCSRITEWLFQAVSNGRLPFAGDAAAIAAFEDFIGGEYVLRGAGLGNPAITDGRAWVLEDPILPPPLYEEAGQPAEEQEFGEGGCPALMNWLAGELGIEEDEIDVFVANTFAYSSDIQPCEACARLKEASTILEDAEGTGVAGLVQVVNEFVATPAPPSEEQMASIATAFADHTDDGTYYATAGEWIDALVEYVGILTFEMGYSAEESTGYASKYIEPVTDTGNASLIAYVQARLAALGG